MTKDTKILRAFGNRCIVNADYSKAIRCATELLALDEADVDAMYMAAAAYMHNGEYATAIAMAERALEIKSDYIGIYVVLAYCYKKQYAIEKEIAILIQASQIAGNTNFQGEICSLLGSAYSKLGQHNKAMRWFSQASEIEKDNEKKIIEYSNYLFLTNYTMDLTAKQMLLAHTAYNKFFENTFRYNHDNRGYRKNKLRIGYVSPDFRNHAVVYFSYSLLSEFTEAEFEVYCYSNGTEDAITKKLKTMTTAWRDISRLGHDDAARLIYEDKIDILVDLAGHTANNSLPIFARKPAPVQISGIGYFNTTGLKEMDYFLTDIYCDPLGGNDKYFTEKLMRLPHTHLCYTPKVDMPGCQGAPCQKNGFVTFGSFNNFSKVTDNLLTIWWNILKQVPGSKLILKSLVFASAYARQQAMERMEKAGMDIERIELREFSSDYLAQYHEVDIALDTYPYPGGATTCEALYMGVPVISLVGKRHGARFGYSILRNIGLEECAVFSEDEYIERAVAIAQDKDLLDVLHKNLRPLLKKSYLMDAKQYISDVESAYRQIWEELVCNKGLLRRTDKDE